MTASSPINSEPCDKKTFSLKVLPGHTGAFDLSGEERFSLDFVMHAVTGGVGKVGKVAIKWFSTDEFGFQSASGITHAKNGEVLTFEQGAELPFVAEVEQAAFVAGTEASNTTREIAVGAGIVALLGGATVVGVRSVLRHRK